jgi:hypothetical protein
MTDTESEEARLVSEDRRGFWSDLHSSPDARHHQQRSRCKTFQLDNMISDLDASIKQLEEFLDDEANQELITNVAKMILCTLVERGVVGIRRRVACKYPFKGPVWSGKSRT